MVSASALCGLPMLIDCLMSSSSNRPVMYWSFSVYLVKFSLKVKTIIQT